MILLNDFKRCYKFNRKIYDSAIKRTLSSGKYILGQEVKKFEKEFAEFIGVKYAIGVANGLEALQIGLMCLDLKKNDEVITTPISAFATTLAISSSGAKPVFVDTEQDTGLIDPKNIEEKITKNTKAILPVHLYGQSCDMKKIVSIAKKYNLYVVEDCCQAHGALFNDKPVGSFGTFGCFSFYPTKNLGGIGDGGAIVTNSKMMRQKILMLRNYGQNDRYHHKIKGLNSRLDEIQAAVLREKLKKLRRENKRREKIALKYNKEIDNPLIKKLKINKYSSPVWHLYPIRCNSRKRLQDYLRLNEVQTLIHYPIPIPFQRACLDLNYKKDELPLSTKWSKTVVSIPVNPYLQNREVEKIIKKINEFKK